MPPPQHRPGETRAQRQARWEYNGHDTSVQCTGHTLSGARCKRRTRRSPYCYYHLEKEEHVRIKPSGIPGAGLGLFTTTARRPNQKIAFYGDKTYVNRDPDHGGSYVFQVKQDPPTFINPWKSTESAGRFANMARQGGGRHGQGSNNAQLMYSPNTHKAFVKAKAGRGIPANREIKASYGHFANQDYWARHD